MDISFLKVQYLILLNLIVMRLSKNFKKLIFNEAQFWKIISIGQYSLSSGK